MPRARLLLGDPSMERGQRRRRSFGRYLDKFKAVLKRRTSTAPVDSTTVPVSAPAANTSLPVELAADPSPAETQPNPSTDSPGQAPTNEPLAVPHMDTSDDEELLPMRQGRSSISEERSNRLFAKYGISPPYNRERDEGAEPSFKKRRVERPIRIRVHWTCHDCKTVFGTNRTCGKCGHARCDQCDRDPPKRVKRIVDSTKDLQNEQERLAAAIESQPGDKRLRREVATFVERHALMSHPELLPLECNDAAGSEILLSDFDYSQWTVPRSGIRYVHRSKAQICRRQCHMCRAEFIPASNIQCKECKHLRCASCPRLSKAEEGLTGSPGIKKQIETPAIMVPAVERVYRKPRQRVRYSCEKCNVVFGAGNLCNTCGHLRCAQCKRQPPNKDKPPPDPDLLRSVEQRLLSHNFARQPQAVTVQ